MNLTLGEVLKKKVSGDKNSYEIQNICIVEGDGQTFISFKCLYSQKTMAHLRLDRPAKVAKKKLEADIPGG